MREQLENFAFREHRLAALRIVVIEELESSERHRVLHDVVLV